MAAMMLTPGAIRHRVCRDLVCLMYTSRELNQSIQPFPTMVLRGASCVDQLETSHHCVQENRCQQLSLFGLQAPKLHHPGVLNHVWHVFPRMTQISKRVHGWWLLPK